MAKRRIVKKPPVSQLDILSEIDKQSYTPEQKQFVEYQGEESVILAATAGAGKTYSCVQRLKELLVRGVDPKKIIFFSFTKAATEELQHRVGNKDIRITTIHAFCYNVLASTGKFKNIATFYDFIDWFKEKYKPNQYSDKDSKQFYYDTISSLYEEADYFSSAISAFKLQSADGIKSPIPQYLTEYNSFLREKKSRDFCDMLVEVRDMFKEDKWLKMFRNKYDYIFVDEYQDTSTIQLQILLALNAKYYYLIGDRNQCVIEGTKVHTENGIKNIEELNVGDKVLSGKGSDNLDYKKITNIFKNKFAGEVVKIKTKSGKELITTKEHTHFAKYIINEKELFFTYLMYKKGFGFRIGVTKSYHNRSSFENSTRFGFMNRLNGENAQKIWLLEVCDSEKDSKIKEIQYSLKYGLPTLVFKNRGKDSLATQEYINEIFDTIDTNSGGLRLLKDKGFDFDIPHHFPKSIDNKLSDRNINICLCADGRSKKSIHKIEIGGMLDEDKEKLLNIGLKVQNNGKNTGWRIRNQSNNFKDLIEIKDKFLGVVNGVENRNVLLKKGNALNFTKASYLLRGMTIYVLNDKKEIEYDIIESVEIENYNGFIYDINVENTHNFIANNIFTHNSIYGYSGANCSILESMIKERRKTKELSLSVNFRSDQNIVENSNKFSSLKALANSKEKGYVDDKLILKLDDLVDILKSPEQIAILVRTNDVIKKLERQMLKKQVPMKYFNFITQTDIKNFRKGEVTDALKNKLSRVKDYFSSDEDLITFIEQNQNSNKFITTIHKSKGREFDTCVVVNSIAPELLEKNPNYNKLTKKQIESISFDPDDDFDVEPRNIHYVAVSRSKHKLYFMVYMV